MFTVQTLAGGGLYVGAYSGGPVMISVAPYNGGVEPSSWTKLGCAEDGVLITGQQFKDAIHSDCGGGLMAPPVDEAILKHVTVIDVPATTTFNVAVLHQLATGVSKSTGAGAGPAQAVQPGTLIVANGLHWCVELKAPRFYAAYYDARLDSIPRFNVGPRHTRLEGIRWVCHPIETNVANTAWNAYDPTPPA